MPPKKITYRELVERSTALPPDAITAKAVQDSLGHRLGPTTFKLMGQVVSLAKQLGLPETELARRVAAVGQLDPDIRQGVLFEISGDEVEAAFAEPAMSGELGTTAMVACTPSAFIGMCVPQGATVALLRSMHCRATAGYPWSSDWFRREAFRLSILAGQPTDMDVARSSMVARIDTAWSAMAAECLYEMLRSGEVRVGDDLWVAQAAPRLECWMYQSWLEKLREIRWLSEEFVSRQYVGVSEFVRCLGSGGAWSASVFDGEDLLRVDSDPSTLKHWFSCFSVVAHGKASYSGGTGVWRVPFMPAREGVGVLALDARLPGRPDALLRPLRLPGVLWACPKASRQSRLKDGVTMVDQEGGPVPVMELGDEEALESGVFYLRDETGARVEFWHIGANGSEKHGKA